MNFSRSIFFWTFFPQNVSPHYANEGLMKRKWNWLILEGVGRGPQKRMNRLSSVADGRHEKWLNFQFLIGTDWPVSFWNRTEASDEADDLNGNRPVSCGWPVEYVKLWFVQLKLWKTKKWTPKRLVPGPPSTIEATKMLHILGPPFEYIKCSFSHLELDRITV